MRNYRILKNNYEFDRVYKRGKQCHGAELSLFFFKRKDNGLSRYGVTVSKAIKGAVKKNRVKRVLRALFREHAPRIKDGYDLILHGKVYPEKGMYRQFEKTFVEVLKKSTIYPEASVDDLLPFYTDDNNRAKGSAESHTAETGINESPTPTSKVRYRDF